MIMNPLQFAGYCWIALGILWTVGLLFHKPAVRRQSVGTRLFHLGLAALGFSLLGSRWFQVGWLGMSFLPPLGPAQRTAEIIGAMLTVAGCLFAAWARIALGSNWSGAATVKNSHELITEGPYSLARHPIYTGLLTAVLGTGLVIGEWRSIIGVIVIFLALAAKISQEERLMLQEFPAAYRQYRQRVRALIPGLF